MLIMWGELCAYKMAKNLLRFKDCISSCRNVLLRDVYTVPSRNASTLILSGRKAAKSLAYINPYIDFETQLSNIEKFQEELDSRGLNISAHEMKRIWETYKETYILSQKLQDKRIKAINSVRKFQSVKSPTESEKEKLALLIDELNVSSNEFKKVQHTLWDLQETTLLDLFKLPNRLDVNTPRDARILTTYGHLDDQGLDAKSHIEIGKDLGLLEYKNPVQNYLCNAAVLFELGLLEYAADILRDNNMFRMTSCDFCRSVLVEGTGVNHEDPWETFIIAANEEIDKNNANNLHLMGTGSMTSMLVMFTKALLEKDAFPIRCFSTGRQYVPCPDSSVQDGLFVACQASAVQAFAAVTDPHSAEYQNTFDEFVEVTTRLYKDVCDHFRIVLRAASELKHNESKRVSFELWSSHAKKYVEVGYITAYGDYLSKRILMSYKKKSRMHFPGIISGTVVSVPRLLACLLERNPDRFEIPEKIRTTSIFTGYDYESTDRVKKV